MRSILHEVLRPALLALSLLLTGLPAQATNTGELRFVAKEFPPYVFAGADGRPAGPMVDLLFSVCAKAGWQCTVSVLPWRRAYTLAAAGEVDGIFPIVQSPARLATFELSPNVVRGRYVLMALSCPGVCPARSETAGRRVAALGPSEASKTLQELVAVMPETTMEIEPDHHVVMRKLLAGRYGANGLALVNEAVAWRQVSDAQARSLQSLGVVRSLDYTYAFTRHRLSAHAAQRFADALNELCRSGEAAQTFKPYGLAVSDCPRSAAPRLPSHRYILR